LRDKNNEEKEGFNSIACGGCGGCAYNENNEEKDGLKRCEEFVEFGEKQCLQLSLERQEVSKSIFLESRYLETKNLLV